MLPRCMPVAYNAEAQAGQPMLKRSSSCKMRKVNSYWFYRSNRLSNTKVPQTAKCTTGLEKYSRPILRDQDQDQDRQCQDQDRQKPVSSGLETKTTVSRTTSLVLNAEKMKTKATWQTHSELTMRPDSLLRLWRYINHYLTYLLRYFNWSTLHLSLHICCVIRSWLLQWVAHVR